MEGIVAILGFWTVVLVALLRRPIADAVAARLANKVANEEVQRLNARMEALVW